MANIIILLMFVILYIWKPDVSESYDGIYLTYNKTHYDSLHNMYWIERKYLRLFKYKSKDNDSNYPY